MKRARCHIDFPKVILYLPLAIHANNNAAQRI
ncbi:MAG: hypothetical protein JWM30_686 [Burkholderia sp.]|nr:hypothetical protein [Burkholderia sp.]